MIQKFIIEGNPRGQGRPKATIRGRHAGVYKAKQDAQNEDNIRAQIVAQRGAEWQADPKLEYGALHLSAIFYMPRPKAHFNSKGEVKPRYEDDCPTGKPDLDNLLKAVKDACNGVVWRDDSQVVRCVVEKRYATDRPHTEIEVS